MRGRLLFLFLIFITALPAQTLEEQLRTTADSLLREVLRQPYQYQLQLICTALDGTESTQTYGLDSSRYFYPATTVALPLSILSLERLNKLSLVGLDQSAQLRSGPEALQAPKYRTDGFRQITAEALQQHGRAADLLFNFLGGADVQERLQSSGYGHLRIIHRLEGRDTAFQESRYTPEMALWQSGQLRYYQGRRFSPAVPQQRFREQVRGVAYVGMEEERIPAPFDFRWKNAFPLIARHRMMQQLIAERLPFELLPEDYRLLREGLRGERSYLFPDLPEGLLSLRGAGYGFLTETAYLPPLGSRPALLISVVLHLNENQVYQDGVYEYESVGGSVLRELGRVLRK